MGELIFYVLGGIGVISGAIALDLIREQTKASIPQIADWLRQRAVKRLPEPLRERLGEEWAAQLDDTPGPLAKLWCAFGFLASTSSLRAGVRPRRIIELIVGWVLRRLIAFVIFATNKTIAAEQKNKVSKDDLLRLHEEIRRLQEIVSGMPGAVGKPDIVMHGPDGNMTVEVKAYRKVLTKRGEAIQSVTATSYKGTQQRQPPKK